MGIMYVLGFFAGLALAVSITLLIMVTVVKKSNDWGDYDAGNQAVDSFEVLRSANNVKKDFDVFERD